jgi:pyruvate/2-oxoglutarate dehydrogenase complex dihydrolipoamide acyltransferase (E2) component
MVVDALDLCYTKSHVDTFVIISGDSDFSPLVSKLRENNKTVIGVGVKNSSSDLLIANCDEFIYYDDLVREKKQRAVRRPPARKTSGEAKAEAAAEPVKEAGAAAPAAATSSRRRNARKGEAKPAEPAAAEPAETRNDEDKVQEALDLVTGTTEALAAERGGDEKIWGSMVKQALKRVKPGFNESYYGFRSFNALLEEAAARGLLMLERDEKSGGYAVRLPSGEA